MELIGASWDLDSGRTVTVRVVEPPGPHCIHPFKEFTHKRGGRAGTVFQAVMFTVEGQVPVYADQVMMSGWGEDNGKGQWVRFWLDESAAVHPFAGLARKRAQERGTFLMCVLIELDDDGTAIDQDLRAKIEKHKRRSVASQVAVMVRSPTFVQWLREKAPADLTAKIERQHGAWDGDLAHRYVRYVLNIESMGQLNTDKAAFKRFENEIRKPYEQWSGGNGPHF
jgi:hypothetical protein